MMTDVMELTPSQEEALAEAQLWMWLKDEGLTWEDLHFLGHPAADGDECWTRPQVFPVAQIGPRVD